MSGMIRRLTRSPHFRPIASIASGAALAQVLGVVITPIITRLYSPSEYGATAIYVAMVAIGVSVATGRYESAVSLPAEDDLGEERAISLVRVALLVSTVVSVGALPVVTMLYRWADATSLNELGVWVFAVPLGILTSAMSATLSAYATRRRNYSAIARIPPVQKVVTTGVQVGGGLIHLGLAGLMLGALVAPFVGLGVLRRTYRAGTSENATRGWRWAELFEVARNYSDFPRIGVWFALLNALAWNMQVVVLAKYFGAAQVGQFALASAVIALPMGIILAGVSQVYMRECAARADDRDRAMNLAIRTAQGMLAISLPLVAGLALASKFLFGYLFGHEWAQAGSIALAMMPLLWARFLTTSLTTTLSVYRRQGVLLVWQVIALGMTLSAYLIGGERALSITDTVWLASAFGAPMYLLLLPIVFAVIGAGSPGTKSQ